MISKRNFTLTQIDSIGVGIARAAATFLPVFMSRNHASALEISLLVSMPAVAGFLFAFPIGRFIQQRRNLTRWYAWSRIVHIGGFFLSGLIPFFLPQAKWVTAILIIWAIISIPQIILDITFNVVMNRISGSDGRYELMSRRWAILGLTTSIFTFIGGQLLGIINKSVNFQITLMLLSFGGIVSLISSLKLRIPESPDIPSTARVSPDYNLRGILAEVMNNKPFVSIVTKRLIFSTGVALGMSLFALYYVRGIQASNSWIAAFGTAQTASMVIGYFFWNRVARRKGTRTILIWSTLLMSLYPIAVVITDNPWVILGVNFLAGLFQAGVDLVLFDELMKTFPAEKSSIYISISHGLQYFIAFTFPVIGSVIANNSGLVFALIVSGFIKIIGFFTLISRKPLRNPVTP